MNSTENSSTGSERVSESQETEEPRYALTGLTEDDLRALRVGLAEIADSGEYTDEFAKTAEKLWERVRAMG